MKSDYFDLILAFYVGKRDKKCIYSGLYWLFV